VTELGVSTWPPVPIRTDRLVLRATCAEDRPGYLELQCSAEVRRYLGGPRPRVDVEASMPAVPGDRPGVFAVALRAAFIGTVMVSRREPTRPGHVRPDGEELEISYTFLPRSWGQGLATEAVTAVLDWIGNELPGEPVVLCTQSANTASVALARRLGFVELERFVEFGAEQWFGVVRAAKE